MYFSSVTNITKFYILNILAFQGLMIFDMVIYVTLINLTEMECILLLLLKSKLFLCLCVLKSFGQIKVIFCGDENFKNLLHRICKCF